MDNLDRVGGALGFMVGSDDANESMLDKDIPMSPFRGVAVPDRYKLGCPWGLTPGHIDEQ